MMYVITYDFEDGIYYHRNNVEKFNDRDTANRRWKELRSNIKAHNMRHSTEETYIAVQVVFYNYGKKYTYLSKEPVEIGKYVVVQTADGMQVVTCTACSRATKAQLETICPFEKFKYIVGVVK